MPDPLSWSLIALFLVFTFFCSASETALSCCNRFKMQIKADEGKKSAKLVLKTLDKFDRALTVVLVIHNIASVLISTLSTFIFLNLFKNAGINDSIVSLISSICMSLLVYLFGDALPKTIARNIPDTITLIFIYPLYGLLFVLTYIIPITLIFDGLIKLFEKIFKVKKEKDFTEEDLENTIEKVSDEGLFVEEQSEIIQSTLEFSDTNVKEVLTPKDKMMALDISGLTHEKLKEFLIENPYSRIPIYDKEFDNIIGILLSKDYCKAYIHDPNVNIRRLLQKPYFVSSNIMIDDLFNGFKKHHTHIALVKNRKDEVIGMVTMEDVLEEIVDDIGEPSFKTGGKKA